MRSISSIKWTEDSIDHIANHGVTPKEVEEVCFNEEDLPLIRSGGKSFIIFLEKRIQEGFSLLWPDSSDPEK